MLRYTSEIRIGGQDAGPLSLSLPLSGDDMPATAWLDGLLPDSIAVRRKWARRHGANSSAPMSLLSTPIGLDCAGAVQFTAGAGSSLPSRRTSGVEWVAEAEVAEWVRRARDDWDDWDGPRSGGQFSLGGAQAKCAVRSENGRWGMPYGDTPTSHILKPGVLSMPDADVVEHLCLRAAGMVGLDASRTTLERFDGERVLAVERYDRVHGDGTLARRHQEDLCQSLGVPPGMKYQIFGGPGPETVAAHLWAHADDPHEDVARFAEAVAYSWLIGAPDAHAKNYSLILERHSVWLAPVYDVISFVPFAKHPIVEQRMAMSIGAEATFGDADNRRYWESFAETIRIPPEALLDRISHLARRVPAAFRAAAAELHDSDAELAAVRRLLRGIAQRCETLTQTFPAAPDRSGPAGLTGSAAARRGPLGSVVCGHRDGKKICRRKLLTRACPLHRNSPGSQEIRRRRQVR